MHVKISGSDKMLSCTYMNCLYKYALQIDRVINFAVAASLLPGKAPKLSSSYNLV